MDTLALLEETVDVTVAVPPEVEPDEEPEFKAAVWRVNPVLRVSRKWEEAVRLTHLDRMKCRTRSSSARRLDCRRRCCSHGYQSQSLGCCRGT